MQQPRSRMRQLRMSGSAGGTGRATPPPIRFTDVPPVAEDRSPWLWGAGTAGAVLLAASRFGSMIGAALGLVAVIVATTIANYRRKP